MLDFNNLQGVFNVASLTAFAGWVAQLWKNRIQEKYRSQQEKTIEQLKADLTKKTHVHRVQFEKEFAIYEKLWGSLIELRTASVSLRPAFDVINENETEEARTKKRLDRFSKAYIEVFEAFQKSRPFYSKEVFTNVEALVKTANSEAISYKHGRSYDAKYWGEAEKNAEQLAHLIDLICEVIRVRIGNISTAE